MDVLKKVDESRMNIRLNPDAEGEEEAGGEGDASRDERAVARPQPTIHEEKPVRIIFISAPMGDLWQCHAKQVLAGGSQALHLTGIQQSCLSVL